MKTTYTTFILASLLMLVIAIVPLASFADEASSTPAVDIDVEMPSMPAAPEIPDVSASSTPLVVAVETSTTTEPIVASSTPESPIASTTPETTASTTATTEDTSIGPPGGGGPVIALQSSDVIYTFPTESIESVPESAPLPALAPPIHIVWKTAVPATTRVFFSTSTAPIDISSPLTPMLGDSALSTTHSVTLNSLFVDTPYDIVYQSRDSAGMTLTDTFMNLNIHPAATSSENTRATP